MKIIESGRDVILFDSHIGYLFMLSFSVDVKEERK